MIDFDRPYRVRAVQRDGDDEESPTRILEAERLAAASTDTLSPIISAMGARLWRQQIIPRRGNVLLEEISGHYYLKAFWKLTNSDVAVSFLPATGASKLPQLAFLFVGWGLEFGVVMDDDSHGRGVFNDLKRDLFGDNDDLARQHLHKVQGCRGIEDIFSPTDFRSHVCPEYPANTQAQPSTWMKNSGLSKPLIAYRFMNLAESQNLKLEKLEQETQDRIKELVAKIEKLQAVRVN